MVPQAPHGEPLGHRLHRRALPLAALDEAPFLLIELDKAAHSHFGALDAALVGGIFAVGDAAENGFGLLARLFRR